MGDDLAADTLHNRIRTVPRGRIADAWIATIRRAIELGDDGAAYRLTVALVRRLREVGAC